MNIFLSLKQQKKNLKIFYFKSIKFLILLKEIKLHLFIVFTKDIN